MRISKIIYRIDGLKDDFNIDVPFDAIKLISVSSEAVEEYDGETYTIVTTYWEMDGSFCDRKV